MLPPSPIRRTARLQRHRTVAQHDPTISAALTHPNKERIEHFGTISTHRSRQETTNRGSLGSVLWGRESHVTAGSLDIGAAGEVASRDRHKEKRPGVDVHVTNLWIESTDASTRNENGVSRVTDRRSSHDANAVRPQAHQRLIILGHIHCDIICRVRPTI